MRIVETDMLFPNKEFPMKKKTFLRVNLQMLTYRVFIVFFEEVILNYLTHSLSSCAVSCHLSFFFCYHNTNSSKSLTLLLHFLSLGLTKSKSTKHELLLIIKSPFRKLGAFDTSTCTSDVQFAIHAFQMFIALKLGISDPKYV